MTNSDDYEGWSNQETWAVNIWLANHEQRYKAVLLLHQATKYHAAPKRALAIKLRAYTEQAIEQASPIRPEGLAEGLIQAALAGVDWDELAEHWQRTCREVELADSVTADADTLTMDELEASAEILDRAMER